MAAGIADHVWLSAGIVSLLDWRDGNLMRSLHKCVYALAILLNVTVALLCMPIASSHFGDIFTSYATSVMYFLIPAASMFALVALSWKVRA
jgi:hypothetical protein